jgi:hypothetical protein
MRMKQMNERDAQFFRPLWLRVVVTAGLAVWFGAEAVFSQDQLWMTITGLAFVYAVWTFFIRFPKDPPPGSEPPKQP